MRFCSRDQPSGRYCKKDGSSSLSGPFLGHQGHADFGDLPVRAVGYMFPPETTACKIYQKRIVTSVTAAVSATNWFGGILDKVGGGSSRQDNNCGL